MAQGKLMKKAEKKIIEEIIEAWDVLMGDRNYSTTTIEDWLIQDMHPVINKARKFMKKSPKE